MKVRVSIIQTVVSCFAVVAAATCCLAQSAPVSQVRSMSAMTSAKALFCSPDEDEQSMVPPPGFDPWNATLTVSSEMCGASITATLTQQSSMTPNAIHAASSAGFSHPATPQSGRFYISTGNNEFTYTFHIPATTTYSLDGAWMISGNVVSQAFRYISLRGPGGFLFTTPGNANAAFSSTGRLTPGDYTISGLLNYDYRTQNVTEGHLSLAYSLDVAIAAPPACACDWDVSGGVSSQDFFTFITDFFAGNADFNDSGATNSQDLFDFLGCFFSRPEGCN